MLDDDKGEIAVGRRRRKEHFERIDAAGRRADADDREISTPLRGVLALRATVVRSLHPLSSRRHRSRPLAGLWRDYGPSAGAAPVQRRGRTPGRAPRDD